MLNPLIAAMIADGDVPPGIIADALKDANPLWEEGMPVAKLYVISGTCGAYSDTRYWIAAAFLDKGKGEATVAEWNAWLTEHAMHGDLDRCRSFSYDEKPRVPFDSHFEYDNYYGSMYSLCEIPLMG